MSPRCKNIVWGVGVLVLLQPYGSLGANQVVNGGFETVEPTDTPLPSTFGDWGGDVTAIVTAEAGIVPPEGSRMLHFINTNPHGPHAEGVWSELKQLVDVSAYSGMISSGTALMTVSYLANRVAGDAETDTEFGVYIAAYAGPTGSYPAQYKTPLAVNYTGHITDSNVATWELITGDLLLPVNTDFVAVLIYAAENIVNDAVNPELDGHYADDVTFDVIAPIVAEPSTWGSIKALYWGDTP